MAYYNAVTKDFPNLVRFPVLGAGPGRFGSDISVSLQTPLVRRYIQPFLAEMHRSRLGMKTTVFTRQLAIFLMSATPTMIATRAKR